MKYCERFKDEVEFGKFQAQRRLKMYEEYGETFDYGGPRGIDLLKTPDWQLSETMKKQKQKVLKNIEYLQKVVNGEVVDPFYTYYFNARRNSEWAEWYG